MIADRRAKARRGLALYFALVFVGSGILEGTELLRTQQLVAALLARELRGGRGALAPIVVGESRAAADG